VRRRRSAANAGSGVVLTVERLGCFRQFNHPHTKKAKRLREEVENEQKGVKRSEQE